MLEANFIQTSGFEWKMGFNKVLKKRVPPLTQTNPYDHGLGLPDSPPNMRGFLNKKQLPEQETTTAAHFWINFWALFWNGFFLSPFRIFCVDESWNRKRQVVADVLFLIVSFQRPVIWHALGQGPANSKQNWKKCWGYTTMKNYIYPFTMNICVHVHNLTGLRRVCLPQQTLSSRAKNSCMAFMTWGACSRLFSSWTGCAIVVLPLASKARSA